MSKAALILFAHGARDPEWADPMRRVGAALRQQAPELRVELAFLEFMQPTLRECAESLLGGVSNASSSCRCSLPGAVT